MIGNRLKEERERLGLTQPDFAAAAGAAKRTLIEWEKGKTSPSVVQLSALSEIGVDAVYVLMGIRSPAAPASLVEQQQAGYSTEVLSKDEQALLDNYRHCPQEAKQQIEASSALYAQLSKKRA